MSLGEDMQRREFITLLGGAAACPFAVRAQPADRIARVGFFGADRSASPQAATLYQAIIDELQIRGFKNGQNLIVDFRRVEQGYSPVRRRGRTRAIERQRTRHARNRASPASGARCNSHAADRHDSGELRPVRKRLCEERGAAGRQRDGGVLRRTESAGTQTELLWQAFPDRTRIGVLSDAISADQFSAAERRAKSSGCRCVR